MRYYIRTRVHHRQKMAATADVVAMDEGETASQETAQGQLYYDYQNLYKLFFYSNEASLPRKTVLVENFNEGG